MKKATRSVLFLALLVGVAIGLMAQTALAGPADTNSLTSGNATDFDSSIINGRPADLDVNTSDSRPGFLYVGYNKTNGTKTSASAQGTQDTIYTSDTVLGVPAAQLFIRNVKDADSAMRQVTIEAFARFVNGFSGETYPRPVPSDEGDTFAPEDSVPWLIFETAETGVVMLSISNTSNYACTFTVLLHAPDTDFRTNRSGAGDYIEAADARLEGKFRISLASDTTTESAHGGYIRSNDHTPHVDSIPVLGTIGNPLAEDAETFVFLRIAADTGALARDTIRITVVLYPDSGPNYSKRFARVFHDSGYRGDNDTFYGEGGSEDSVSVFALIATAIVRAQKKDTVYAPRSYLNAVNDLSDARKNDTVPGSLIVYTITYDNDGNRRADSITLVDFLDSNVDLYVGNYPDINETSPVGSYTFYSSNGIDTRMTHGRWNNKNFNGRNMDTAIIVEFAPRSAMASFVQETHMGLGAANSATVDSTMETVGAIRIRWGAYGTMYALQRDQFDNNVFTGLSVDPLHTIDTLIVNTTVNSDSGDAGRIRFAVVIR